VAHFSGPPIAGKVDRITENDDSRTGLIRLRLMEIELHRRFSDLYGTTFAKELLFFFMEKGPRYGG
jgi:hypothetical protein